MKLAVASALRPLMPEHGARVPQAFRTFVGEVMFQHGAYDTGCTLRPQGQLVTVHAVGKGIHFFLDDIRDSTEPARKQSCGFNNRRTDLLIAVATQHRLHRVFK